MSDTATPAPAWNVTAQVPATMPGPNGKFQKGVNISFVTTKGFAGEVFVPDTMYEVEQVRQIIAAQAAKLDAVGGLTG